MIIAYSVAQDGTVQLPAGVRKIAQHGCQAFFADADPRLIEQDTETQAINFFRVNRQLFAQTTIIEFRFPTLLNTESELAEFLERSADRITHELSWLSDKAQITVYLEEGKRSEPASTGTEYLQAKKKSVESRASAAVALVRQSNALDHVAEAGKVHLLIPRSGMEETLKLLSSSYKVAGPFPPSSFAKLLF
jgi:hypothetical protein